MHPGDVGFFFGPRESPDEDPAAERTDASAAPGAGSLALGSPVEGTVIALSEVSDKVFASGSMGDGFAVVPTSGHIVSPVSGRVVVAMKTGHAFGLKTDSGVEVLVHIGIDTVQLRGAGFTPHVTKGDVVGAGDPLCDVDLEAVSAAGYDPTTVVIVTNTGQFSGVTPVAVGTLPAGADAAQVAF